MRKTLYVLMAEPQSSIAIIGIPYPRAVYSNRAAALEEAQRLNDNPHSRVIYFVTKSQNRMEQQS